MAAAVGFRYWVAAWSEPSHYVNQWQNLIRRNKLKGDVHPRSTMIKNCICQMANIPTARCVNVCVFTIIIQVAYIYKCLRNVTGKIYISQNVPILFVLKFGFKEDNVQLIGMFVSHMICLGHQLLVWLWNLLAFLEVNIETTMLTVACDY